MLKEKCDCGGKVIWYRDFHAMFFGHCITCGKEYKEEDTQ